MNTQIIRQKYPIRCDVKTIYGSKIDLIQSNDTQLNPFKRNTITHARNE